MAESVGSRIKSARESKGLTQDELAQAIGMERTMVSRWERDEATPRGGSRLKVANALDVSNEWLRTGEGPQKEEIEPGVSFLSNEGIKVLVDKYIFPAHELTISALKAKGINLDKDATARVIMQIAFKSLNEQRDPTETDVAQALMQLWE